MEELGMQPGKPFPGTRATRPDFVGLGYFIIGYG
ncbi:hypothetical protein CCACVL1_30976 [Corchorus capsularis]|uniref:Uncharacterized protein n=1 Tax=Corchorus capsularis TaxID=210143 RepID=A0A1R3FUG2_COCAP|nr:hypothetical protein CCACVL1_30976 [Corchorus capsularis]